MMTEDQKNIGKFGNKKNNIVICDQVMCPEYIFGAKMLSW